ncbi:MAG: HAMP domain-containing sensor histidine kinase [Pseudomonadota bacterium]
MEHSGRLQIHQLPPNFIDASLEQTYRDHLIDSKRALTRVSLALAAVLLVFVEPIARLYFPAGDNVMDQWTRWFVNVPAVLTALISAWRTRSHRILEAALTGALVAVLLSNALLMWFAGGSDQTFYAIASIQIMLFGFMLLGLRFIVAFYCIALCFALPATIAFTGSLVDGGNVLTNAYITPLLVFFGLAFSAYSLDVSERRAFVAGRERDLEYRQRLELERERSRWLKTGSDFLNHEMKNALLGITSSLHLLEKRNEQPDLKDYIARADGSARFMQRLFSDISASTSLEAALESLEPRLVDVSDLLRNKIEGYRDVFSEHRFELLAPPIAMVFCDGDRVAQLLDKLVDNAVAHSDPPHPIRIELKATEQQIVLAITNVGKQLADEDVDLFDPFVRRASNSGRPGYGFGLYVVRRIAQAHGGWAEACSTKEPEGARFTVFLPGR